MAKYTHRTKVIVNGVDISRYIIDVTSSHRPNSLDTATITVLGLRIEYDAEGNVTFRLGEEGA